MRKRQGPIIWSNLPKRTQNELTRGTARPGACGAIDRGKPTLDDAHATATANVRLPVWAERTLYGIVALNVFMMMVIIFVDVFLRYLFNAPIPGSYEIVRFMMAIMIFSAMPLVTVNQGHIVIGLFDGFFQGNRGRIRDVAVGLVSCAALCVVCYLMFVQGGQLARFNKITGYLELPLSPLAYGMAALAVVAVLAQLRVVVYHLTRPVKPQ